jgi:hypothetical protein
MKQQLVREELISFDVFESRRTAGLLQGWTLKQ